MPTLSFHATDQTSRAIRVLATQQCIGISALVKQLVEEGLKTRRFPGLVFRDGPTGRRAGIAGSLDVWEIVALLQEYTDEEQVLLKAYPSLTAYMLKTARAYAEAYPEEIEARITASQQSEIELRAEVPTLFTPRPIHPARRPTSSSQQHKARQARTAKA